MLHGRHSSIVSLFCNIMDSTASTASASSASAYAEDHHIFDDVLLIFSCLLTNGTSISHHEPPPPSINGHPNQTLDHPDDRDLYLGLMLGNSSNDKFGLGSRDRTASIQITNGTGSTSSAFRMAGFLGNGTGLDPKINELIENDPEEMLRKLLLIIVLGLVIILIVCGNLFVIVAVLTERHLRKPQNSLIVSLAVADLIVGLGVVPLALFYEVVADEQWHFGQLLCDVWITTDIAACSASILNMVAIALDRYWSVTDIHYAMNAKRGQTVLRMIPVVWLFSLLISVLPVFGWQDRDYHRRLEQDHICLISQEYGFQIVSSIASFYAPLITIFTLHCLIYGAAKEHIRRKGALTNRSDGLPLVVAELSTAMGYLATSELFVATLERSKTVDDGSLKGVKTPLWKPSRSKDTQPPPTRKLPRYESVPVIKIPNKTHPKTVTFKRNSSHSILSMLKFAKPSERAVLIENARSGTTTTPSCTNDSSPPLPIVNPPCFVKPRQKTPAEIKRERRAFHTLAIVTGAFVICWLPFFAMAFVRPICGCDLNSTVRRLFTWLGWLNSMGNPVIYTVFSPDFRRAFQRIFLQAALICTFCCRRSNDVRTSPHPHWTAL